MVSQIRFLTETMGFSLSDLGLAQQAGNKNDNTQKPQDGVGYGMLHPLRVILVVTEEALGTSQNGKLPSIVSPSPAKARLPSLHEVFSASSDAYILSAIWSSTHSNHVEEVSNEQPASSIEIPVVAPVSREDTRRGDRRQLKDPAINSIVLESHENERTEEQTTEGPALDEEASLDPDNLSEADQAIYYDRTIGCSNQQRALLQGEGFCNPWLLEKVGQACLKP